MIPPSILERFISVPFNLRDRLMDDLADDTTNNYTLGKQYGFSAFQVSVMRLNFAGLYQWTRHSHLRLVKGKPLKITKEVV